MEWSNVAVLCANIRRFIHRGFLSRSTSQITFPLFAQSAFASLKSSLLLVAERTLSSPDPQPRVLHLLGQAWYHKFSQLCVQRSAGQSSRGCMLPQPRDIILKNRENSFPKFGKPARPFYSTENAIGIIMGPAAQISQRSCEAREALAVLFSAASFFKTLLQARHW